MSAVVTESKRSEVLMWECYVMEGRQVEEVEEEVLLLQMIRLRSRWPSDEITNTFKKKDANWRSNFCAQLSKFIWAEHFHYLSSKHKNIFTLSITGGAYEWWYDPQDTYICVTLWVVTLRQWMIDERLMWQLCHSNQCQLDSKGNVVTENFQLAILEQKWAI